MARMQEQMEQQKLLIDELSCKNSMLSMINSDMVAKLMAYRTMFASHVPGCGAMRLRICLPGETRSLQAEALACPTVLCAYGVLRSVGSYQSCCPADRL